MLSITNLLVISFRPQRVKNYHDKSRSYAVNQGIRNNTINDRRWLLAQKLIMVSRGKLQTYTICSTAYLLNEWKLAL